MLTYKRKLILTKAQEQRLISWIGACRLVYNMSVGIKVQKIELVKANLFINAVKNIMGEGIALNRQREAVACA